MTPSAAGTLLLPRSWRASLARSPVEAAVGQLTAAVQRHRAVSGEPTRRLLEAERSSGTLARGLDAYRDQLDGVGTTGANPGGCTRGNDPPAPVARLRTWHEGRPWPVAVTALNIRCGLTAPCRPGPSAPALPITPNRYSMVEIRTSGLRRTRYPVICGPSSLFVLPSWPYGLNGRNE